MRTAADVSRVLAAVFLLLSVVALVPVGLLGLIGLSNTANFVFPVRGWYVLIWAGTALIVVIWQCVVAVQCLVTPSPARLRRLCWRAGLILATCPLIVFPIFI